MKFLEERKARYRFKSLFLTFLRRIPREVVVKICLEAMQTLHKRLKIQPSHLFDVLAAM